MTKTSEAPHRGQPGEAPKLDETRQKNPSTSPVPSQGSTAGHLRRIADALDRYLRSRKGGRR